MGTWDLESVEEEDIGQTIHLADLLAICSVKHVELEPQYRTLKGRACYRGDKARTEKGNLALTFQSETYSSLIVLFFRSRVGREGSS